MTGRNKDDWYNVSLTQAELTLLIRAIDHETLAIEDTKILAGVRRKLVHKRKELRNMEKRYAATLGITVES